MRLIMRVAEIAHYYEGDTALVKITMDSYTPGNFIGVVCTTIITIKEETLHNFLKFGTRYNLDISNLEK